MKEKIIKAAVKMFYSKHRKLLSQGCQFSERLPKQGYIQLN